MIDTKKLRQSIAMYGLEATCADDLIGLLDRLEAADKELVEIRHGAAVANDTIKALQAKIEAVERQEPVGEIQRANSTGNYICSEVWVPLPVGSKLYALPGAKGEGK